MKGMNRSVEFAPSEKKEMVEIFQIVALNERGIEEEVGVFEVREDKVFFSPSSVLESVFQNGNVTEFVDPKDVRTYHVSFPKEVEHICPSMIFGIKRSRKDVDSFPEIMASIGRFGDESWTWRLSEEQWRKMDEWLQKALKK